MKTETLLKNNKKLIVSVLIISIIILAYTQTSFTADIGYLSGRQGLEVQFNSLRWHDKWWSTTEKGSSPYGTVQPSIRNFGGTLHFDPDEQQKGMPDILASTQTMTRDTDLATVDSWLFDVGQTIMLSNGSTAKVYKQYELFSYRMDWAMNLWLDGSEWEADGKYNDAPNQYVDGGSYSNSALWLKIVPKTFMYFLDSPDQVYFAPVYIVLKEPAVYSGIHPDGTKNTPDADTAAICDIIPQSTGEPLYIYYNRGGTEVDLSQSEILNYKGVRLDPAIFRTEYWSRIDISEFQAHSWIEWGYLHGWKYPSVYLHFQVDMFVVGEWTVYYSTGEIPALEPHEPNQSYTALDELMFAAEQFFSNPFTQLWIFFILIVIVLIVVSVFNPMLLSSIFHFITRKKGGETT